MKRRGLTFDADERARLREVTAILGVTFEEFIHHATMHAVDEVLGVSVDYARGGASDGDFQEMFERYQ